MEKSVYIDLGDGMVQRWYIQADGSWVRDNANIRKDSLRSSDIIVTTAPAQGQQATGDQSYETIISTSTTIQAEQDIADTEYEAEQETISTETAGMTDWGAKNITKEMLINPDGTPRTIQEIYTTLDPILTGISGEDLVNQIKDMLPKYTGVPGEEKEAVGRKYEADIYGLQPGVGGAVTPTTGAGARGKIGTQAGIKKGFEAAGEAREYSIYGLEKGVTSAYETDVVGAIGGMETPFGDPGADAETTEWADITWSREGGRVPSSKSETFLDFLTQLPDAGGV
tara:strand:+ start:2064 stop:2912 length:849 start_codon:yes stop_codon:yes gene_type:complete